MATLMSDNGWPGIENRNDTRLTRIAGTDLLFRTAPAAAWILSNFTEKFHTRVESLNGGQLDDWSYAWRTVRGSQTRLSCHASGTAVDLNALKHPRGVRGTFSAQQMKALRKLLAEFKDPATGVSVIKWGGDFSSASIVDEMHFQINGDSNALKRAKANIVAKEKETDDVSFKDRHTLTDADVAAYGRAGLIAGESQKSFQEIVRFPPAVERLRRESAERDKEILKKLDDLTKAVEALKAE